MRDYTSITKTVILGSDENGVDVSDKIKGLLYRESMKKLDTVEFYSEGQDALALMDMAELDQGRFIFFTYGYITGAMSTPRVCVIADLEPRWDGKGGVTLTINCLDKGFATKKTGSRKIWEDVTTEDIVKAIAEKHGLGVDIQTVGAFMRWDVLPQGKLTDMQFLQWLAAKEAGGNYICFIQNKTLHFVTRGMGLQSSDKIVIGESDYVIDFRIKYRETRGGLDASGVSLTSDKEGRSANGANPGDTTVHGESYTINFNGVLTGPGKGSLLFPDRNTKTDGTNNLAPYRAENYRPKKDATPAQDFNLADIGGAADGTKDIRGTVGRNAHAAFAGYDPNELANEADSRYKKARAKVLTAELQEEGNPSRRANTVVTVGGVPKRYAGNWYIESVTQHVMENGYTTQSTFTKNGTQGGPVKATKQNDTEGADNRVPMVNIRGNDGRPITGEGTYDPQEQPGPRQQNYRPAKRY